MEKLNLDSFLKGNSEVASADGSDKEHLSVPERLRLSFEELGPTFIKFGQLMASRPDLIPPDYIDEMSLLHDRVQEIEFSVICDVIAEELGPDWKNHFQSIEEKPLGSASIAQVHAARLKTGEDVVLKVQRPGIVHKINDDLNVLYFIAELVEKYIPEVRSFNPIGMVDEYFKTLELETNFVVEANNIRRFKENFAPPYEHSQKIMIPKVYFDLTTERVLTMQRLMGKTLSDPRALLQTEVNPETVIQLGLKAYLKMVFVDGFFHGDLHAGNFLIFPHNVIGLIDFGVVGRLNSKTQMAIVNMLIALSKEDYLRLAYEYVDLAPFSEDVNVDTFAKDLQSLISPYYGLTLKNVNVGKILMSSSSIAARHGLKIPTELMLFFKSIISIEGLGQRIQKDFDFLSFILTQVGSVAQSLFEPAKMTHEAQLLFRESKTFLAALPRQLNLIFRRMNSPDYRSRVQIDELQEFRISITRSFSLLFLGVVISALIIASSLIYASVNPENSATLSRWHLAGIPGLSLIGYSLAALLGLIAFVNYIRGD